MKKISTWIGMLLLTIMVGGCITEDYNLRTIHDVDRNYCTEDSTSYAMMWKSEGWREYNMSYWTSAGVIITNETNLLGTSDETFWVDKVVEGGFKGLLVVSFDYEYIDPTWADEPSGSFKNDWYSYIWNDTGGNEFLLKDSTNNLVVTSDGKYILNPASVDGYKSELANIISEHIGALSTRLSSYNYDGSLHFGLMSKDYDWATYNVFLDNINLIAELDPLNLGYTYRSYIESDHELFNKYYDALLYEFSSKGIFNIVSGDRLFHTGEFNSLLSSGIINGQFFDDVTFENASEINGKIGTLRSQSGSVTIPQNSFMVIGGLKEDVYHMDEPSEYASVVKTLIDLGVYFTPGADGTYFNYPLQKTADWWVRSDDDSNWESNPNNPVYTSASVTPTLFRSITTDPVLDRTNINLGSEQWGVSDVSSFTVTNIYTTDFTYTPSYTSPTYIESQPARDVVIQYFGEEITLVPGESRTHIVTYKPYFYYDNQTVTLVFDYSSGLPSVTINTNGPDMPSFMDTFDDTFVDDWDSPSATYSSTMTLHANRKTVVPNDYWYNHTHGILGFYDEDGGADLSTDITPNSTHDRMWYLTDDYCNMERAWAVSTGDSNMSIGIVDTDFNPIHTDINTTNGGGSRAFWNFGELTDDGTIGGNSIVDNGIDDDENGYIDDYQGWDMINGGGNNKPWYTQDEITDSETIYETAIKIRDAQHGSQMSSFWSAATNNEGWWLGGGTDLNANPQLLSDNGNTPDINTTYKAGIASMVWNPKVAGIQAVDTHYLYGDDEMQYDNNAGNVAAGIQYFTELKMRSGQPYTNFKVISLSVTSVNTMVEHALIKAYDNGITVSAGAGNSGIEGLIGMATKPTVLSLGVLGYDYDRWDIDGASSNYHSTLDVSGYGASGNNGWNYTTKQFRPFSHPLQNQFFTLLNPVYSIPTGDGSTGRIRDEHYFSGVDINPDPSIYDLEYNGIAYTPAMSSGTSAQGAGLAALVISAGIENNWGDLTPMQVEHMIKRGARNVDSYHTGEVYEGKLGVGGIDAYKTLTLWGTVPRDTVLVGNVFISGDVKIPDGVTVMVSQTENTRIFIAPDNIMEEKYYGDNSTLVDITIEDGGVLNLYSSHGVVEISPWIKDGVDPTTGDWGSVEVSTTGIFNQSGVELVGSEDWNVVVNPVPSITDGNSSYVIDGQSIAVSGSGFANIQGTGSVSVSNTSNFATDVATQVATMWTDTGIIFDLIADVDWNYDDDLYIRIINSYGESDISNVHNMYYILTVPNITSITTPTLEGGLMTIGGTGFMVFASSVTTHPSTIRISDDPLIQCGECQDQIIDSWINAEVTLYFEPHYRWVHGEQLYVRISNSDGMTDIYGPITYNIPTVNSIPETQSIDESSSITEQGGEPVFNVDITTDISSDITYRYMFESSLITDTSYYHDEDDVAWITIAYSTSYSTDLSTSNITLTGKKAYHTDIVHFEYKLKAEVGGLETVDWVPIDIPVKYTRPTVTITPRSIRTSNWNFNSTEYAGSAFIVGCNYSPLLVGSSISMSQDNLTSDVESDRCSNATFRYRVDGGVWVELTPTDNSYNHNITNESTSASDGSVVDVGVMLSNCDISDCDSDWFDLGSATVSIPILTGSYRTITVDETLVASDISDYPLLISMTEDWLKDTSNTGVVRPDGFDIQFSSDTGGATLLDYEIETYDGVTGKLVAWVKIPTLSSSVGNIIYIQYGDSSNVTDESNVNGVWVNYSLIMHMNDQNTWTTNGDVTTNVVGTVVGGTGLIGGAQVFDKTGYIDLNGVLTSGTFDPSGGSFTAQVITYMTDQNDTSPAEGYNIVLQHGDTDGVNLTLISPWGSNSNNENAMRFETMGNKFDVIGPVDSAPQNQWVNSVCVYDNAAGDAYVYNDGSLQGTDPAALVMVGGDDTYARIGAVYAVSTYGRWGGLIDELRFTKSALTPNQIQVEYNNYNPLIDFYTVGTEQ